MAIIWAIVLFGVLIFFHELGHFIASKSVGVKVLKFSLGFGPKIIGKKIGETEYVISAVPLGGYVKPLGEEIGEELSEEDKPRAFNFQPVWKRMTIVVAGPLFNFVLAYFIYIGFLSMNYPVIIPDLDRITNTTIEYIEAGSPAMKAGIEAGDKVVAVNDKDISAWPELQETVINNPGREVVLKVERNGKLLDIYVTPADRVISDLEGKEITVGTIGAEKVSSAIADVLEDSPAMRAGLQRDDVIVGIDGKVISNWIEMATIFSESPGKELNVKVRRGDEIIKVRITPEPKEAKNEKGETVTVGRIGITQKRDIRLIQSESIISAPIKALVAVYEWSELTVDVVVRMLTGSISAKQVGGPILIVNEASKAAERSIADYFNLIAMISINLAILNLLPVPVLDGGHVVFLSIEALRRKPLSEKVLLTANRVGMSLLFMLIGFVFYNDIMRIVIPWVQKSLMPE